MRTPFWRISVIMRSYRLIRNNHIWQGNTPGGRISTGSTEPTSSGRCPSVLTCLEPLTYTPMAFDPDRPNSVWWRVGEERVSTQGSGAPASPNYGDLLSYMRPQGVWPSYSNQIFHDDQTKMTRIGLFTQARPSSVTCAQPGQFLPRDAMRKRGLCCGTVSILAVRPSVCHVGALYPDAWRYRQTSLRPGGL